MNFREQFIHAAGLGQHAIAPRVQRPLEIVGLDPGRHGNDGNRSRLDRRLQGLGQLAALPRTAVQIGCDDVRFQDARLLEGIGDGAAMLTRHPARTRASAYISRVSTSWSTTRTWGAGRLVSLVMGYSRRQARQRPRGQ